VLEAQLTAAFQQEIGGLCFGRGFVPLGGSGGRDQQENETTNPSCASQFRVVGAAQNTLNHLDIPTK